MDTEDEFFERVGLLWHSKTANFNPEIMCWDCWGELKTWVHWQINHPCKLKQYRCDECFNEQRAMGIWTDCDEHSWEGRLSPPEDFPADFTWFD